MLAVTFMAARNYKFLKLRFTAEYITELTSIKTVELLKPRGLLCKHISIVHFLRDNVQFTIVCLERE